MRHVSSSSSSLHKPIREQNLQYAFTFSKRIVASVAASYHNRKSKSSNNQQQQQHHDSSSQRLVLSSSRHHVQRPLFPRWLGLNNINSSITSTNSNHSSRPTPDNHNEVQPKHFLSAAYHFSTTVGSDICDGTELKEDEIAFSVKQNNLGELT